MVLTRLLSQLPAGPSALRAALYQGQIFQLAPTEGSRKLVAAAVQLLHATLGDAPRRAQQALSNAEIFRAVGRMRRTVYLAQGYHQLLRKLMADLGFDLGQVAFDPARLRAVLSGGHHHPAARAAYFAHRDTWYANPQATITCWLPLHDLHQHETFVFYPDCFSRAVPNDSAEFDYASWVGPDWSRKIGWQDPGSGQSAHYPASADGAAGATASCRGPELGFSCRAAEILLFSAAHLHRTLPLTAALTRFSLDFRMADLADVSADRGAPNADNASRGDCLRDYVHPGQSWPPIPLSL